MLWIMFLLLPLLWRLGVISGCTIGEFSHVVVFLSLVVASIRVLQGRRPV